MTIEEFNKTRWGANMKAKVLSTVKIKEIVSVNFETNCIGFAHPFWDEESAIDDLDWVACEDVELV